MSKDKDIVNNDSMHSDMSEREVEKAGLSQENVRQILGHRITVAIGVEPGKTDEDKNHLKHYDDLSFPLRLSSVTFDSLQSFENKLKAEFPWMESLIVQIHKQCYLRLVMERPEFYLRPILLVGPHGIGKTRFLRRVGEELQIPLARLNLGGSTDNRELEGTSRGWSSGDASFPVKIMARYRCPNPIVVLDEIDKESESNRNGRMTDTLHQLLERENAKHWRDQYLCCECDLSNVTWLATANHIEHLAPSLLSRFTIVKVRKPVGKELLAVVHGAMADFAEQLDLNPVWLPTLTENEWEILENLIKRKNPSPRVIVRWVQALMEIKLENPDLH